MHTHTLQRERNKKKIVSRMHGFVHHFMLYQPKNTNFHIKN